MGRIILISIVALGLWLAFGPDRNSLSHGPAMTVSLAELAAEPARWDGRRVTVSGRVVDRASVMGLGGVLIADDLGNQILAAGLTGPVVPGRIANVTGDFRLVLAVGDLQIPVILTGADRGG